MQLLRWNNPGARHHTSVFYGEGLDVANQTRASGGGRKMFLTSPYIDQAITRFDRWSLRCSLTPAKVSAPPHLTRQRPLARYQTNAMLLARRPRGMAAGHAGQAGGAKFDS